MSVFQDFQHDTIVCTHQEAQTPNAWDSMMQSFIIEWGPDGAIHVFVDGDTRCSDSLAGAVSHMHGSSEIYERVEKSQERLGDSLPVLSDLFMPPEVALETFDPSAKESVVPYFWAALANDRQDEDRTAAG